MLNKVKDAKSLFKSSLCSCYRKFLLFSSRASKFFLACSFYEYTRVFTWLWLQSRRRGWHTNLALRTMIASPTGCGSCIVTMTRSLIGKYSGVLCCVFV